MTTEATEGPPEGGGDYPGHWAPGTVREGAGYTTGALSTDIPAAAYDLMLHARRQGWYYRIVWQEGEDVVDGESGATLMTLEVGRKVAPFERTGNMIVSRDRWLYHLVWTTARNGKRVRPSLVKELCWARVPTSFRDTIAPSLSQIAKVIIDHKAPQKLVDRHGRTVR